MNSFNPLSINEKGLESIKKFNLPSFIDGSCRREPDFENELPCITGLCRPKFAKKLKINDTIIYVTNKRGIGSRKIVAVLEVIKIFENHREAANWYINENKIIPNNLMVDETIPNELNRTHRINGIKDISDEVELLKLWDSFYKLRSQKMQKVVQCKINYIELNVPKQLIETNFTRKLTAQNPPILNQEEFNIIEEIIYNE